MKHRLVPLALLIAAAEISISGCRTSKAQADEAATAPPPVEIVEQHPDLNLVRVEQPERFELVSAARNVNRDRLRLAEAIRNCDCGRSPRNFAAQRLCAANDLYMDCAGD